MLSLVSISMKASIGFPVQFCLTLKVENLNALEYAASMMDNRIICQQKGFSLGVLIPASN